MTRGIINQDDQLFAIYLLRNGGNSKHDMIEDFPIDIVFVENILLEKYL